MIHASKPSQTIERAGGAERADLNRPSEIYQRRDRALAALRSSSGCARCGKSSSKRTAMQSPISGQFRVFCPPCKAFVRGETRTVPSIRPMTVVERRARQARLKAIWGRACSSR